jgi:hypothetical protein
MYYVMRYVKSISEGQIQALKFKSSAMGPRGSEDRLMTKYPSFQSLSKWCLSPREKSASAGDNDLHVASEYLQVSLPSHTLVQAQSVSCLLTSLPHRALLSVLLLPWSLHSDLCSHWKFYLTPCLKQNILSLKTVWLCGTHKWKLPVARLGICSMKLFSLPLGHTEFMT